MGGGLFIRLIHQCLGGQPGSTVFSDEGAGQQGGQMRMVNRISLLGEVP